MITNGRSNVSFAAVANAYQDVRVRVSYPTVAPTVASCSTDSFAIRPSAFVNFSVTDNDPQTAGTARTLNNVAFGGGAVVHKAGQPFTVRSDAVNSAGSITTNYVGAPAVTLAPCGGASCTATVGSLTATTTHVAGQLTTNAANYSDVGSFTLQLDDGSFAMIDSGDSTVAERTISSGTISVGRFVPDHFAVALNAPQFDTACGAGGFTYVGQKFNYSAGLVPVITVTAKSAGVSGGTTALYAGAWFRIDNTSVTGKTYTDAGGALDTSGITGSDPVIAPTGVGQGTLTFGSGSGVLFTRAAAIPPFNASTSLSISVIDLDGIVANIDPVVFAGIPFSTGSAIRYGRVRMATAVGSELVDLPVAMKAEYYGGAGVGFVTNTDDTCTSGISLAFSGYTKNLSPGETCARDSGSPGASGVGCAAAAPAPQRFKQPPSAGDFNLVLAAPGVGNSGSVSISVTPGSVPVWLKYDWNALTPGDEDPSGQATFGVFGGKSRQIYTRENY
jgi:MSHA biogenesis protein MshQ